MGLKRKEENISRLALASITASFIAVIVLISIFLDLPNHVKAILLFSALLFFLLAILLGILALIKIHQNNRLRGKLLAILGIIIGYSFLLFYMALYILYASFFQIRA